MSFEPTHLDTRDTTSSEQNDLKRTTKMPLLCEKQHIFWYRNLGGKNPPCFFMESRWNLRVKCPQQHLPSTTGATQWPLLKAEDISMLTDSIFSIWHTWTLQIMWPMKANAPTLQEKIDLKISTDYKTTTSSNLECVVQTLDNRQAEGFWRERKGSFLTQVLHVEVSAAQASMPQTEQLCITIKHYTLLSVTTRNPPHCPQMECSKQISLLNYSPSALAERESRRLSSYEVRHGPSYQ